jgi:hypothetical protein
MRIDGSSNKNDWSVEVTEMDGSLWLRSDDNGFIPDSVHFVVQSGELKSGRSTIMDRLMYRALKSTQYPDIVYTLSSTDVAGEARGDTTSWTTTGTLDLAGVTDTVGTTVRGYRDPDGRFVFTGTHTMSMKEHDITPPTAMFGALHTREFVTIVFDLVFGDGEASETTQEGL